MSQNANRAPLSRWHRPCNVSPQATEAVMCRRVRCEVCNKPSYTGCGRHVEEVLGAIAKADRCTCRSKLSAAVNDTQTQRAYVVSAA